MTVTSNASNSPTTIGLTGSGIGSTTNLTPAGTLTSSSNASGYPASNAKDGNTSTYWESLDGSAYPQTLTAKLAQSYPLGSVTLTLPPSTAWSTRTETLSVLGSTNGTSWTTLVPSAGYTFNPATGNTVSLNLPSGIRTWISTLSSRSPATPGGTRLSSPNSRSSPKRYAARKQRFPGRPPSLSPYLYLNLYYRNPVEALQEERDMTLKASAAARKRRVALGAILALLAGLLGLTTLGAAPAQAASSPKTPIWSTQLDFDSGGAAWSESYFAGLAADGLTTAELNMPWGTIEPTAGTFSFTIWDQELANAAAAGIQLIPVFWSSGWSGSPAPWITDLEKTSGGTAGQAPDWWNSTQQSEYFTYVEDTIQNSIAQPGGYGGAILNYGYLDAQWDISGSGGGYTTDDVAEFQNTYLPDTYGTIATFNTDEGTSYTSFSQVPAEASGQSLFGVFQAFRAWSVQQTYGQLTADVRSITASTPLYYYYGGGFGNVTNYANNPDTFFQLAKQYNVTFIADSASNTGMTLALTSLGRGYGVKVAEEWTAPSSNSELAAYAVQWLDSYGMTFPQAGGEDFFIHDGTAKDTTGFPIYTSWLPTLKSLSGSYPQQPVALYIDVSQGYGNTSGGSLSSVQTEAANDWDSFQSGLAIVTSQEVDNGAVKLSSFKAVLPLNGTDANLASYGSGGGTLLATPAQLTEYATAYSEVDAPYVGDLQTVPVVSASGTSAAITLANITTSTAYNAPIAVNPAGLVGLNSGSYYLVNAAGTAVPQTVQSNGLICATAAIPAASLAEWTVKAGSVPAGTAFGRLSDDVHRRDFGVCDGRAERRRAELPERRVHEHRRGRQPDPAHPGRPGRV